MKIGKKSSEHFKRQQHQTNCYVVNRFKKPKKQSKQAEEANTDHRVL
jgi:hypothetical protein